MTKSMNSALKQHISWQEVHEGVEDIAVQLKVSNYKADCIVGIGKGGLIPSVMLATKLQVPVFNYGVLSYEHTEYSGEHKVYQNPAYDIIQSGHRTILVCDDLTDSGRTLQYVKQELCNYVPYASQRTCTLFHKYQSSFVIPDFFHKRVEDVWVVFPWEATKSKEPTSVWRKIKQLFKK